MSHLPRAALAGGTELRLEHRPPSDPTAHACHAAVLSTGGPETPAHTAPPPHRKQLPRPYLEQEPLQTETPEMGGGSR